MPSGCHLRFFILLKSSVRANQYHLFKCFPTARCCNPLLTPCPAVFAPRHLDTVSMLLIWSFVYPFAFQLQHIFRFLRLRFISLQIACPPAGLANSTASANNWFLAPCTRARWSEPGGEGKYHLKRINVNNRIVHKSVLAALSFDLVEQCSWPLWLAG